MTRQDAVLDALYRALEKWDEAERRVRDLRMIAGVRGPMRVERLADGTRIPAPRRSAMARFLTDAAMTAIREWEAEA